MKIENKNSSFDSLMEVLPKEIASSADEIFSVNDYKVIKADLIFEIKVEDLKDGNIWPTI